MNAAQQNIDVNGAYNRTYMAGQDINVTEQYYQTEPDFITPRLEPYKPPQYKSPRIARHLVKVVEDERLLLMGGSPDVEKAGLARFISWRLTKLSEEPFEVKEWLRGSESRSLISTIRDTEAATIFLLIDLQPQDVHCDLNRLQQVIEHRHYVVATTEVALRTWRLDAPTEKAFWQSLTPKEVYDEALLSDALQKALVRYRGELPKPFDQATAPETSLVGEISIWEIAVQLMTPTHVDVFANLLRHEAGTVSEGRLRALIEVATNPSRIVSQSFQTLSDTTRRLSALGFSFFEGLLDDQAFAAVEQLYRKAWRVRNPDLNIPDYCDLGFLHDSFFSFVETDGHATLLENRFPEQRRLLLEAAWHSDRRQLIAALPILTDMVRESVSADAASLDRELFGNQDLRSRLRDAVADTLSDVGLISPNAVENSLLTLAAEESLGAQGVAARAMARWRRYGKDEQLFEQLNRWQEGAYALKFLRALFEEQEQRPNAKPEDFLRATIALTVGYAAQYDHANHLSPTLVDLLDQFADDPSQVVRNAFRELTLRLVVPLHVKMLKDRLKEMTRHLDLTISIARSLAIAYRADPPTTMDILDGWYQECMRNPQGRSSNSIDNERESLLVTVVFAYGLMDVEPPDTGAVTDRLKKVLVNERHPIVREGMMITIAELAKRDFGRFSGMLKQIVSGVRKEEMHTITRTLLDIFKKERCELEGGDDWIEHLGVRYPIWLDAVRRPLTNVEQALLSWLSEKRSTSLAQQIALKSWVSFESFLREPEQARIKELLDERRKSQTEQPEPEAPQFGRFETGIVKRASLAPFWVTLGHPKYLGVIRALTSQALVYGKKSETLGTVLDRWEKQADAEVKRIARYLRKALRVHEVLPYLVGSIIVGLCAIVLLVR